MSWLSPFEVFKSSFFNRYGSQKECEGLPELQSLQFHTVMQGRQHQSPSRLLQLPAELLDRTIDFLEDDKKTLANLALVNSVCLCLARVRQFKEIYFDYSPQSHELIESLENKNKTKLPFPIGIFVQKFTFAPLEHLALPTRSFDLISKSLEACELLPNLQTLVVPEMPLTRKKRMLIARFIERHNHIQNLYLSEEDSSDIGDDQMSSLTIPILAKGGFDNLRCLSLSWVGETLPPNSKEYKDTFPEQSLVALSKIGSLEQLSLRFGPVCHWIIDHDRLRRHLNRLNRLKKLVLLHDTYHRSELKDIRPEKYYDRKCLLYSDRMDADARLTPDADEDYEYESDETAESPPAVSIQYDSYGDLWAYFDYQGPSDERTWERVHRNRMLMQAEAYPKVFPDLEWIYCGQRPMRLRHHPSEDGIVRKEAIPLSKGRVTGRAFLDKTFGIEE